MKPRIFIILPILVLIHFGCSSVKITRERIEWSDFWWENEPDTTKPRVLFIGNSISRGYFPEVSTRLSEIVNCDRYSTSRSVEDPAYFKETKMAMANYHHLVINFNNGLHGLSLTNEQYRKGLEKYVKFLKSKKSKGCILIYSLTTPLPSKEPGQKLDPVRNQVVIDRNRVAREIMEKNGIPVIDLYELVEPDLERYSYAKGNGHFNEEGNKLLAELISKEILKLITK